jgi:hypothetical protein
MLSRFVRYWSGAVIKMATLVHSRRSTLGVKQSSEGLLSGAHVGRLLAENLACPMTVFRYQGAGYAFGPFYAFAVERPQRFS